MGGQWLAVYLPSAHEAMRLVYAVIDHFLLERGCIRDGSLYFDRPQATLHAIDVLRESGQWLLCGKMPVFGEAKVVATDAVGDAVVRLVRADLQWRADRREEEATADAGWLDDIERDYLHRRKPSVALWHTSRLNDAACTHYLRWADTEDDGQGLYMYEWLSRSYADLLNALDDIPPTLAFDYPDEAADDQEAALTAFAQKVADAAISLPQND